MFMTFDDLEIRKLELTNFNDTKEPCINDLDSA